MNLIVSGIRAIIERGWKAVVVAIIIGAVAIKAIVIIGAQTMEKASHAVAAAFEPLKQCISGLSGLLVMFIIVFGVIAVGRAIAKIRG